MTKSQKSELIKQKLYLTLYRLGIAQLPDANSFENMYIDDSGYVMLLAPDGVISIYGRLSLSGDFIIKN